MSLKEKLDSSLFAVTAEIAPPKGSDPEKSLATAEKIAGRVDGINVTDNQRAVVRMSALAFCKHLIDAGCEPILQVCGRDRNRLAIQSDLLGAYSFGIKNICLMTGDHTALGDAPGAKPVFDLDSVQLIQMATDLSRGISITGQKLKNFPDFLIGGVINPFYSPIEMEMLKTRKKISAGASFFQTQPFFDTASLKAFIDTVKPLNTKILVGITPIKSLTMAAFLNDNVLTTPIPDNLMKRIEGAKDQAGEGLKIAAELVNEIKSGIDGVSGVHLMPIGQVEKLPMLLEMTGC
ncbi:MAG: methylenetetrahydrofolate reductase [Nitrospinota bacterium]|nr:methylenetetrahydrofolate reductase [Nitrospinota bacterium]